MNIIYLIDFNCPYSYIGLKRIKKAADNLGLNAEWEIKSFELEPLTGKASISACERYAQKFEITESEASEKLAEIENIAHEDGIEMKFKDMTFTSSKDAHRLSKYMQAFHPEITLDFVEKVFYANFCENKNIADNDLLTDLAISCGLEESAAKRILDNNYYNIEAELDREEALIHNITATPCFILTEKEEKLIIPGVFSLEEFETALKDFDEGSIDSKTYGTGSLNQY